MVLARLLAAFNYAWQKTKELCVCVVRIVHMLRCLCPVSQRRKIDATSSDLPIGPF